MGSGAVEVAGSGKDAKFGQSVHERPRVGRVGGVGDPQVQAGRTVGVNVEAGVGQGLEEEGASRGVDLPLVLDVLGAAFVLPEADAQA